MTDDVDEKLRGLISKVLRVPLEELPAKVEQESLEAWDSMGHLRLILALEKAFSVSFPTDKIPTLTSLTLIRKELEHATGS